MISIVKIQEILKKGVCPICNGSIKTICFYREKYRYRESIVLNHVHVRNKEIKMVYGEYQLCRPYTPTFVECNISEPMFQENFKEINIEELKLLMNSKKCPACRNTIDGIKIYVDDTTKKKSISFIHEIKISVSCHSYTICSFTNYEFYDLYL